MPFLFFLFLTFKSPLGSVDILNIGSLLVLIPIPAADLLDPLDRRKIIIVNVEMMGNPNKWFMNVCHWIQR